MQVKESITKLAEQTDSGATDGTVLGQSGFIFQLRYHSA